MTNERNLKTAEIPSFDVMVERNLAIYALATADEECYQRGLSWYQTMHDECLAWVLRLNGEGHAVTIEQFTAIVSIISPGRKWKFNCKDAYATVLAWAKQSEDERVAVLSEYSVSRRYGLPCFRRAWSLLDGTYIFTFESAPKTFSFAHNLAYSETSPYVTVDQHNCHILLGEQSELGGETVLGSIGISYAQYKKLQPVMYHCADLLGIDHKVFQAIVWQWRIENLQVS